MAEARRIECSDARARLFDMPIISHSEGGQLGSGAVYPKGDLWPGVYLRGKHALAMAARMRALGGDPNDIALLESCDVSGD